MRTSPGIRLTLLVAAAAALAPLPALAQSGKKPNILIIWGDDIGYGTSAPTTRA